ncbi:MAG: DUF5615 family PIN-like protein [Dehalococcoidia bacterium]
MSKAILITADKDFGELVFLRNKELTGVMFLRLHGLSPEAKGRLVAKAVEEFGDRLDDAFTVVSPGQLRIRPRKTG